MRNICFMIFLTLVLSNGYGQIRTQNNWILGIWSESFDHETRIWTFNADGSGRLEDESYYDDWDFDFSFDAIDPAIIE